MKFFYKKHPEFVMFYSIFKISENVKTNFSKSHMNSKKSMNSFQTKKIEKKILMGQLFFFFF